jgi:RNA polymerase sigma-70 factor (ECF subfamily)
LASEDHVIASVLAGDTSEFRKLVEQFHQPVFRFARNLIGDEHDAEDITQEVFLAAFNHLASYRAVRASFQTWLFTIARNRCVNYLKRKRPLIDRDVIASTQHTANSDESARSEFWICLDKALDALPIEQKTAFVLAEIEGLPYADIAQIEQTTLGTVKSRIHRAKQHLRDAMERTLGEKT